MSNSNSTRGEQWQNANQPPLVAGADECTDPNLLVVQFGIV